MELIKWLELTSERGRNRLKLEDYDFYIYKSLKGTKSNEGNYLGFSDFISEIYKNKTKARFGLLGNTIVIYFNNEIGVNIHFNKNKDKSTNRMRISSRELVDLIFEKLGKDENKPSNIYSLNDLGNNTFSINRK
jgi:hypothetical protein